MIKSMKIQGYLDNPVCCIKGPGSKAFGVVWHYSMLRKLSNMGISPASWNILKDSYTGMSSVVNWVGELSRPFVESKVSAKVVSSHPSLQDVSEPAVGSLLF